MGTPTNGVIASARTGAALNLGADVTATYQALYVGGTGDIKVDLVEGGTAIIFRSVPVGFFPVAVSKVYSAANGTSASNLVGLNW